MFKNLVSNNVTLVVVIIIAAVLLLIGGCVVVKYVGKETPPVCSEVISKFFEATDKKELPDFTVTIPNVAIVYTMSNVETLQKRALCLVSPDAVPIFGCETPGDATQKCMMMDEVFYYTTIKFIDNHDSNKKT